MSSVSHHVLFLSLYVYMLVKNIYTVESEYDMNMSTCDIAAISGDIMCYRFMSYLFWFQWCWIISFMIFFIHNSNFKANNMSFSVI